MGIRARLEQRQAVVFLHKVVEFAPHVLVETFEQKDVELESQKSATRVVRKGKRGHGSVIRTRADGQGKCLLDMEKFGREYGVQRYVERPVKNTVHTNLNRP